MQKKKVIELENANGVLKKIGEDNQFNRWVLAMGGRRKVSFALDVSEWTVGNWCRGLYNPDVPTIIKIINLSREVKYPITFDDIYKGTTSNKEDALKLH